MSWRLAPSSPRIAGIATLTIDESIVAISEPNAIEIVTTHLLTAGGSRGGRVMATGGLMIASLREARPRAPAAGTRGLRNAADEPRRRSSCGSRASSPARPVEEQIDHGVGFAI